VRIRAATTPTTTATTRPPRRTAGLCHERKLPSSPDQPE
jgi:hypothetical protein